jgi:hypothetical protein
MVIMLAVGAFYQSVELPCCGNGRLTFDEPVGAGADPAIPP